MTSSRGTRFNSYAALRRTWSWRVHEHDSGILRVTRCHYSNYNVGTEASRRGSDVTWALSGGTWNSMTRCDTRSYASVWTSHLRSVVWGHGHDVCMDMTGICVTYAFERVGVERHDGVVTWWITWPWRGRHDAVSRRSRGRTLKPGWQEIRK